MTILHGCSALELQAGYLAWVNHNLFNTFYTLLQHSCPSALLKLTEKQTKEKDKTSCVRKGV